MPIPHALLKQIKRLHLKSRFLSSELFTGEYESAFKGMGMSFEEVREYVPGDDIRAIDWNVTARTGRAHIKVFREEHERSVMLFVDGSRSMTIGDKTGTKHVFAAEIAGVLAYAAIKSNDKVGLLIFTDQVECYIAPKKGRSHVFRIIEELLTFKPKSSGTSLEAAVTHFSRVMKRRTITMIISDLLDPALLDPLSHLNSRHEVVVLHIAHTLEHTPPHVGLMPIADCETGELRMIDLNNTKTRHALEIHKQHHDALLKTSLTARGIDLATLTVGSDYVHTLLSLFTARDRKRPSTRHRHH